MKTNVSAINDHLRCPAYWHHRHVSKRGSPEKSPALEFGIRWHKAMERWPEHTELDDSHEDQLMLAGLKEWARLRFQWNLLMGPAELALETRIGAHTVFGRLDRIVTWNDQFWHLQHKTMDGRLPVEPFTRAQARSYHEQCYRWMAMDAGFKPYGGTILAILRKITPKQLREGTKPPLEISHLAITQNELAKRDLECTLLAMECTQADTCPRQYPIACVQGWRICPYLDVCDGITRIEDMPKFDPNERYKGTKYHEPS